jgi:hypothetical protein
MRWVGYFIFKVHENTPKTVVGTSGLYGATQVLWIVHSMEHGILLFGLSFFKVNFHCSMFTFIAPYIFVL